MVACIANTSPLIALSCIERLDLLQQLVKEVLIPDAVVREVTAVGSGGEWPAARQLRAALLEKDLWLRSSPPPNSPLVSGLKEQLGGSGEAEAIALALHLKVPVFLDEMAGRGVAVALGLEVFGSLRVVASAKRAGRIPAAKPLVGAMIEKGIYFSDDLIERFLRQLGEA